MRFWFLYKNKWYENTTRVVLKNEYIEKYSNEKKIPKEVMFTRAYRDENCGFFWYCEFVDCHSCSCIEYHHKIEIREDLLEDAIEEISYAKEKERNDEEDNKVLRDWKSRHYIKNALGTLVYFAAMFFSLVFTEFYIFWILFTIVYIIWKVGKWFV